MRQFSKWLMACTALLGLSSCEEGQETAATQVFVLVDLSKTWAAPGREKRNEDVLKEVGEGIADAAANFEPPVSVQYRIIGANSLESDPPCDVLYRPRLAPTKSKAEYEVGNLGDLRSFLGHDCVAELLEREPEPLTEIRAAVASAANQPATGAVRRELVIISDFLEETPTPVVLEADLSGFHATLVFRPVAQDQGNASILQLRMNRWKAELAARGARVDALPDTGLHRATIASYLSKD